MVPIASLALPIFLSAVFVFVASSIIHMMLRYHDTDFVKVPNEDGVMDALRSFNIPPGDYMLPRCSSHEEMKKPEFVEKMKKGPVVFMTVFPSGPPKMTKSLILWFVYCLVASLFAAYVAGRALPAGAEYLSVFRFAGCTAFACYALALIQNSIWYNRAWSATAKSMFDGLIYAGLTAGVFGWLWPA